MPSPANDKKTIISRIPEACSDETKAVEFMEWQRWCDDPVCPRCGSDNVYQMRDRKTGEREKGFRWRCRACKRQYSVRTDTVFEDSRIPLKYWCLAFWRACSSKKGVSALQIKRETGLTYKSALFLMHRIRFAMADQPTGKLRGTVEVDETYVGGKPRYSQPHPIHPGKRRRGPAPDFTERKTPVMALVERNGRVKALVPDQVTGANLKSAIRHHVDPSAAIHTDEHPGYRGIGREFAGGHETVNHSAKEYSRGDVTTNTVEGFFSLLKRGVMGTFHHVSKKHLHRYVAEFEFRYNSRKTDDGGRLQAVIKAAEGKRLFFYEPIRSG